MPATRVSVALSAIVPSAIILSALCGEVHARSADPDGFPILVSREAVRLPPFEAIADRPLIGFYAEEQEYEHARSDSRYGFHRLTYRSDDLRVIAWLYGPAVVDRALPTIVFNRGSYTRDDSAPEYLTTFHRFATDGFVVLAPMYRGSEGAPGRDEMGGADLNDLMQVAALAGELPVVDPSKLYLLGESRGGMMVLQAIRDGFPALAAAVFGAPTDFKSLIESSPEQYEPVADQLWPDWRESPNAVLERRSAVAWAGKLDLPLLIMHGGNDQSVPVAQSLALAERLQSLGKPYELHVLAYQNHQLSGRAAERDALVTGWFRRHVPDRATAE